MKLLMNTLKKILMPLVMTVALSSITVSSQAIVLPDVPDGPPPPTGTALQALTNSAKCELISNDIAGSCQEPPAGTDEKKLLKKRLAN